MLAGAMSKPHRKLDFDKKDTSMACLYMDYCYMKADGEWLDPETQKPELADLFSTILVVVDRDTGCLRAAAVPTKAVAGVDQYLVKLITSFCDRLSLGNVELKSDNEETIVALKEAVAANRKKEKGDAVKTFVGEGSIKDSASMGSIEATVRWFQVKARVLRFDLERRLGKMVTPDDVHWLWIVRHAAWLMEKYRVRGDGLTSHFAAYGAGYTGEIVPFGEVCLFKVPMSASRQINKDTRAQKADSTFTKGILGWKA